MERQLNSPRFSFCMCFRSEYVGHAQVTTAGHTYEKCKFPEISFRFHLCILMRCAKGIFAKGILGRTGFSLLRWEKGSETPSCDGEKGLRLPLAMGKRV